MMQFVFTKTPLSYFVASFWRDEAFSYLMARLPIHKLLWFTAQDANPPLYYLVLKVWMSVFGFSEVALRSLSFIFFWATIYVAFLIMKEVFKISTKKSLFYLLLFIINPFLHYYAFEARMYSMMAFIATLLFYSLMKKKYRLYTYVALAALFTHYFLIFVIASQTLFFFFTSHKTERIVFFQSLFKGILWYVPWIIILVLAKPPISQSFWLSSPSWSDIVLLPAIILTGYEKDAWIVIRYLPIISLGISVILFFGYKHTITHQKRLHLLLLVGWSLGIPLGIFILSFFKPLFLPRYFIFSSVGITLLLVVCFEGIKNKYIRYFSISILMLFLLYYSSIQALMRTKTPMQKTFHSINKLMGANDIVYVTHEYNFHVAEYYLPSKQIYLYKKSYDDLPWFIGKVLIDKQVFRDTLPQYPTRAFIVNNDGSYSIQSSP